MHGWQWQLQFLDIPSLRVSTHRWGSHGNQNYLPLNGGVIIVFFFSKAKMKCLENTLLESNSKFVPEHRPTFHRLSINSQEGYSFALLNDW